MTEVQPMKMAAAEGLYETQAPADFSVLTLGTLDGSREKFAVKVPGLLSFLATGSPKGQVRGIDDLAGKRVCAARGTTSATRIQQLQPEATVVTVPMWSDCLVVLQQGQVDAISTDDTILAGLASQDPYLMMVGGSLGVEPYGIGVNKDNPDLVRFVNGTLDRIRSDGTWNRIYDRWLSVLGPSPGPPPAVYRD